MNNITHCDHKDFCQTYMLINKRRIWQDRGETFTCSKCNTVCSIVWKKRENCENKSVFKKYSSCFLWMLPAIVLIGALVMKYLNFFQGQGDYSAAQIILPAVSAIIAITVFHFAAMYYIINSDRLVIKCK